MAYLEDGRILVLQRDTNLKSTIETVAFEIALSVPTLWQQHAVTITDFTEISRSKHEEAAQAFLYLVYTLLEPTFNDFHDIVHSSEVAVRLLPGGKEFRG